MPNSQEQFPTTSTVKIAVMCPGNSDGDKLTPLGERQNEAAIKALIKKGFDFGHVAHPPTAITRQCADIVQTIIKDHHFFVYRAIDGLSLGTPFAKAFQGDMDEYDEELKLIIEAGNTVSSALTISASYASQARQHLRRFLFKFAEEIVNLGEKDLGRKEVLCFSDPMLHTLAVPEELAVSVPYAAPEASCVVYTIQNGVIVNAEFILAPTVK